MISITGIGIVTALGIGVKKNLNALTQGHSGIRECFYNSLNKSFYTGVVDHSNVELAESCKTASEHLSRTSLLGICAAQECWNGNELTSKIKTGLISGTTVGGMDISENVIKDNIIKGEADWSKLALHDSGSTTEKIARHLGITDYVNTVSTACSSASNAILYGARLIQSGNLDRVIVGGSDALTLFTISGFNSIMVYSESWCKPFDQNRNGLNLGEGAAYVLLENERSLKISQNTPIAILSGWSNRADAFHQTATSPEGTGAALSMLGALKQAKLSPPEIDYIIAHGTCTLNNDLTESIAMDNVFDHKTPPFTSTKSFTGHTLAAAGALNTVQAVLSLKHKCMFPTINFNTPIQETSMNPVSSFQENTDIENVMVNALGFGGNCASLIISKA